MNKIHSLILIVLASAVIVLILSGCVIISPTPYTPPAPWNILASGNTDPINCQGFWGEYGYEDVPFSISQPATVEITVYSDASNLPPNDFYVLLLTDNQFQDFLNNSSDYNINDSLYYCDLTQQPNYYVDQPFTLPSGNYYLVFCNEYYQIGRGVYGDANYTIQAQY